MYFPEKRIFFLFISVFPCLLFTWLNGVSEEVQEPVLFKPATFYVARMLDERAAKGG